MGLLIERKIIKSMDVDIISTFIIGVIYEFLKESIMFENIKLDDEGIDMLAEMIWSGLKYRGN